MKPTTKDIFLPNKKKWVPDNQIANVFSEEMYNLSSQILRASDSVALNISEGSILQSNLEFNRFLGYSVRSLAETITCLYKAERRNYISKEIFDKHYNEAFNLMNMLIAFKSKIKQ
ncbi:four helix bundle protein [Flavobacterium sp. ZT3R18]|uniref:four helix bundle protein n=1 Tax=Flavobacterium sp. ZT3R18 TaxID=2594429 RepID=UPI00117AF50F|nr:four helix bundle protein [Flavobacterium sp. ZT3R18]TRX34013.1 four helix bundle protein [Flavobacterium sp. ZT3R18]